MHLEGFLLPATPGGRPAGAEGDVGKEGVGERNVAGRPPVILQQLNICSYVLDDLGVTRGSWTQPSVLARADNELCSAASYSPQLNN